MSGASRLDRFLRTACPDELAPGDRAVARRTHIFGLSTLSTVVAILVVGLTAAGCGIFTEDPGAPGLTVVGTVTVTGQPCPVPPQNSPISSGTIVRVIDSGGAVVSSSPLGPGETAADLEPGGCVFPFSVSGLPPDSDEYTIAIGDDSRLAQQFTTQQVQNNIPVRFVV